MTSSQSVYLWEVSSGARPFGVQDGDCTSSPALSPDGKRVVTEGFDKICLWDSTTGERMVALELDWRYDSSHAFSPDGKRLAVAVGNVVQILDAYDGRQVAIIEGENSVDSLAFSADGKWLAVAAMNAIQISDAYDWSAGSSHRRR